jgi:hypothetical protein
MKILTKKTITKLILSTWVQAGEPISANGTGVVAKDPNTDAARGANGALQQAQSAAQQGQKGQTLALVAGMVSAGVAAYNCPAQNWTWCALGIGGTVLSLITAMKNQKSKNEAINTANALKVDTGIDPANYPSVETQMESDPALAPLKNNLAKLKSTGAKIDLQKGTFTTPNGKKYSASDFSNPASMKAAGFGDEAIGQFSKLMNSAATQAANKVGADGAEGFGSDSYGGGAKQSASASGGGVEYEFKMPGQGVGNATKDRNPAASAAGLAKNFNGEPIGVASDSIFSMMSRRYQLKASQNQLITGPPLL